MTFLPCSPIIEVVSRGRSCILFDYALDVEHAHPTNVLGLLIVGLAIGLVVVSASALMQHVPGNFLETSQRTVGLFVTPLFTLFFSLLSSYGGRRRQVRLPDRCSDC